LIKTLLKIKPLNPTKLAQMMAGKAKLMADVIEKSLINDDEHNNRSQPKSQCCRFSKNANS
jgi:hypothetical protein